MKNILYLSILSVLFGGCPKPVIISDIPQPQVIYDTVLVPFPQFSGAYNPDCDTAKILQMYGDFIAYKVDSVNGIWIVKYNAQTRRLEVAFQQRMNDTLQKVWNIVAELRKAGMISTETKKESSFLSDLGLWVLLLGIGFILGKISFGKLFSLLK